MELPYLVTIATVAKGNMTLSSHQMGAGWSFKDIFLWFLLCC